MTYAVLVLACLAGHPDRCAAYPFVAVAAADDDDCHAAAQRWAAARPWLVPVVAVCREETGA